MNKRILVWDAVSNSGILSKEVTGVDIYTTKIDIAPELSFNYTSFNYIEPNNGYDVNGLSMTDAVKEIIRTYIDSYPIPIEWYKDIKREAIISKYKEVVYAILGDVDASEMASWVTQENEARAYKLDPNTVTPVLSGLIIYRAKNETIDQLADKVIAKADAYRTIYPIILGKYQYLQTQLETATTIEEYLAIDPEILNLPM